MENTQTQQRLAGLRIGDIVTINVMEQLKTTENCLLVIVCNLQDEIVGGYIAPRDDIEGCLNERMGGYHYKAMSYFKSPGGPHSQECFACHYDKLEGIMYFQRNRCDFICISCAYGN